MNKFPSRVSQFLEDEVEPNFNTDLASQQLFEAWERYALPRQWRTENRRWFGQQLVQHFDSKKGAQGNIYLNIRFRNGRMEDD